jgi:BON domain
MSGSGRPVHSQGASHGNKTKDIREAATAAGRVHDVTSVHNLLTVILPPSDDPTLTTVANNALALNIIVPDEVEATASDGNVRLTGTARYGSTHKAAVESAGPNRRTGHCSR